MRLEPKEGCSTCSILQSQKCFHTSPYFFIFKEIKEVASEIEVQFRLILKRHLELNEGTFDLSVCEFLDQQDFFNSLNEPDWKITYPEEANHHYQVIIHSV